MLKPERRLSGDHNFCTGCGEYFNSCAAYEKHRTGVHGLNRRCLTASEMVSIGMSKNVGDWWITRTMTPTSRRRFNKEVHA